ncbi:hypothetical protein ACFYYY_09155 [Streptomyces sp. NPDC001834]|uniref:hypothetical protein n=1 Tax=unclassified Streptomyces TaxID=2593676 RepID=UPI00342B89C4
MPAIDQRRRHPGIAAVTALLALIITGCSGLGRTAVGPVTYTTERDAEVTLQSPPVRGCHRLDPAGAKAVTNGTLVDIVLYRTPDCTGPGATYLATTFTDVNGSGALPWRSFRTIH